MVVGILVHDISCFYIWCPEVGGDWLAGGEEPAFIDVMKKGQLLSSAECAARYPGTDQVRHPRGTSCAVSQHPYPHSMDSL